MIVYKLQGTTLLSDFTGTTEWGGGVAFFTVNTLVAKRRLDFLICRHRILWIEFRIKHRDVLCGVCYRPPDNDSVSLANFFECFPLVLDKIRQLPKQYSVVVLRDFNARYDSTNPSGIAM